MQRLLSRTLLVALSLTAAAAQANESITPTPAATPAMVPSTAIPAPVPMSAEPVAGSAPAAEVATAAEPKAILWIVTKSEFGYNNRFIEYANLAGCEKAWQAERAKASADAQVWCTIAGETPAGALREAR